ncbi:MAG TPA: tetratricopeptide repeat protein [Fredinandcohnia sp.]|nr:tetratricopeptide repeat protein [Fredinandcohnia sp.]
MSDRTIIDATDASFQADVIEESFRRPVVIDFWAAWCAPCRALGPLLERLAEEAGGAFLLAKVNVDENPALARAFHVRGIPAVHAVRNGKVVDAFTGALPEFHVRKWLEGILPGPEDALLAQAAELQAQGKVEEAEALYEKVLETRPRDGDAHFQLARILAARGEIDAAERHLGLILPDDAERLEKEIATLRLKMAGDGLEEAERAVAKDPEDREARLRLGKALAAAEQYERALDVFLEVLRGGPRDEIGEAARAAMVEIFGAVGTRSELADRYRSLMAAELYR